MFQNNKELRISACLLVGTVAALTVAGFVISSACGVMVMTASVIISGLYLGTEFHVNSSIIEYLKEGRCKTLAGTNYVLAEYKYDTEFTYIKSSVQDLILHGYIPIIAHVERYACMVERMERVEMLRDFGALIQVNADAILGIDGFKTKGYVKKLLKKGHVDFVASDSHGIHERVNNLGKCREYLYKKYDSDYVDEILEKNAQMILESAE